MEEEYEDEEQQSKIATQTLMKDTRRRRDMTP